MKVILKKIAPFQAGKVFAVVYGLSLLIFTAPFMMLFFGKDAGITGALLVVPMILVHVVFGFLVGAGGAWIYNLVSGWIGGLEVEVAQGEIQIATK